MDKLVCRMAGYLGLFAAAVFLTCVAIVTHLPVAGVQGGHAVAYAIPGTPRRIDAGIISVLACCGGVAALIGFASLALSWRPAQRVTLSRVLSTGGAPFRRTPGRPTIILLSGAAVLLAVLLLR